MYGLLVIYGTFSFDGHLSEDIDACLLMHKATCSCCLRKLIHVCVMSGVVFSRRVFYLLILGGC